MVESSDLVDELIAVTHNDFGSDSAMIHSTGIEVGLPPMAPTELSYPNGRLSLAEKLAARQRQQGTAYDENNADNLGKSEFPISYLLTY